MEQAALPLPGPWPAVCLSFSHLTPGKTLQAPPQFMGTQGLAPLLVTHMIWGAKGTFHASKPSGMLCVTKLGWNSPVKD